MLAETREAHLQWQKEMITRFQALNPQIQIELVSPAGSDLVSKMQAMLAGGAQLDIGYMDPWLVVEWGRQGILEDLSTYIGRSRQQFRDWYPAFFDLYRVRGGTYALPQDIQLAGIFYNKNAYQEAGLAYPGETWTYDDLSTNARRLTLREADGSVVRHGFKLPTSRNWVPVIWAYGGDLVDDWADPKRFVGNSAATLAAVEYLANLVRLGAVQDRPTHQRMDVIAGFMNQKIAMGLTNTIVMGNFTTITAFDWDVAPLPLGPSGRTPFLNAIGWFMFKSSKHKEEAWQVLQFFTSPEALARRVEIIGNVPPSVSLIQNLWLPSRKAPAHRQLLLADVERSRSPWPLHGTLWSPMEREILAAIWGDKSAKAALESAEAQVKALLAERAGRP